MNIVVLYLLLKVFSIHCNCLKAQWTAGGMSKESMNYFPRNLIFPLIICKSFLPRKIPIIGYLWAPCNPLAKLLDSLLVLLLFSEPVVMLEVDTARWNGWTATIFFFTIILGLSIDEVYIHV